MLKKGASNRDPALHGSCKCSHMSPYAALSKSPRTLADDPMLVLQHPAEAGCTFFAFSVAFKGCAAFMVVKP
ncbi:MAG: hypothetical protein E4H48_05410 [Syntrophobacterales bacterium]|nr:MAG: hypothetical protein E4H48_05410 [Syntrophobacterales bacterium]